MAQIKDVNLEQVKEDVINWLLKLKIERKCSNTNTVAKILNSSSQEIQDSVRKLIAEEVKVLIATSLISNNLNSVQETCNVINGCFDNFTHAVDGVKRSIVEIIGFINSSISECLSKLFLKNNPKHCVLLILDVLHSLSRILILVLKLKRSQNMPKLKNSEPSVNSIEFEKFHSYEMKKSLSQLSCKIGRLLIINDISIDTKSNLAMSALLIREVLTGNETKLIQFHNNFIKTIPSVLLDQEIKHYVLQYLFCNAVINTWSTNIIDNNATMTYLKFCINLCEKYSSDIPIILNSSRTLLLLIKHNCFKELLNSACKTEVEQLIVALLSCIFMLLEHPVACIRHSAKDYLQVLASNSSILKVIMDCVFTLPIDKRSYYISVASLANKVGSRCLIEKNNNLPKQLFEGLHDPTIVSHVSLALENVILNDSLVDDDFSYWCELWVVPLLISLMHVLPIVSADIEKILEKTFKKFPKTVVFIIDKWAHPKSEKELRYVITSLKIGHKQGFKLKSSNNIFNKNKIHLDENEIAYSLEEKWKNLINIKLLEHCLHHSDDDIRISSFSLIIEAHKSTEPYTETDFKLIHHFLKYNLNNQQPATRQKILGLVRKMLMRFSESRNAFLKPSKLNHQETEREKNHMSYERFLDSLIAFCFSNIFVGCNFNRLNTVLNILQLCFENINGMHFKPENTNIYWNKFLVALDSSYEENKDLAVVLLNKLDFSLLDANELGVTRNLYMKAFNLCTHMEPPDVLTGSYLLQALINLPSSKEVLSTYFPQGFVVHDVNYACAEILLQKLKRQIALAKLDLMTAATCGPMYGTLFAIRLIIQNTNFSAPISEISLEMWRKLLKQLVEESIEMTHIVGSVVNSSSPEGHLPMDFQTDFENLLSLNDAEEYETSVIKKARMELIQIVYENFIQKYYELENVLRNSNFDCYETVRTINSLLKENDLLISKLSIFNSEKPFHLDKNIFCDIKYLNQLNEIKSTLKNYLSNLDKNNTVINWPTTAQVLLLCAWRSIKEASLYLGDLVSKLPIDKQVKLGLLSDHIIIRIGEELKILLCEIKHRGAFEHVYIGFTRLINSLWKCSDIRLNDLPKKWMEEVFCQLQSPLKDQKIKLCSTRRSAGLPFMIQAIICSEITSVKSATPFSFHYTMKFLLDITENGVEGNAESKIHALNILRALFKHAQLGEYVASYVSRAMMVAIRGSRASTWPERNSSNLLFSSLIIRIFGVARNKDGISKKNRMTSRTFFQRYWELYDFMLSEMKLIYSNENEENELYYKPSLYLVLLVLGRLYPSPIEDSENIDLSEFLPYINLSRKNPIMKIRELGARALVPLISYDRLVEELDSRFNLLHPRSGITQNERHGILLQIKTLLSESVAVSENSVEEISEKVKFSWIENTKWMLELNSENRSCVSFVTLSCYIKVLHILFKCFPCLREKITEVILHVAIAEKFCELNISERKLFIGLSLFLENFYYIKTDILAQQYLNLNNILMKNKFLKFLKFIIRCKICEVRCVPLRIMCCVLQNENINLFEDDFNEIGEPVKDLLLFKKRDNISLFWKEILTDSDIVELLVEEINKPENELFKSRLVHRYWLTIISNMIVKKRISFFHSCDNESNLSLQIDFAKLLLTSGDKDLSTHAFMCYSVFLMNEMKLKSSQGLNIYQYSKTLNKLMNEFSSPNADIRERMAVAVILYNYWEDLVDLIIHSDPFLMNTWIVPVKLIADEDPSVRAIVSKIVQKIESANKTNWDNSPSVTLKSQELLLDAYINISGTQNIIYILAQMLILALSSWCDTYDTENYSKDEFGVFEKGNPNPYCEELGLSNLVCQKLSDLGSVIDLDALIQKTLDSSLFQFVAECLHLSDPVPDTLVGLVNSITATIESSKNTSEEFSLTKIQIRNLRTALSLSVSEVL